MGQAASQIPGSVFATRKPAREAPARFVAREVPKPIKDVQDEYRKAKHTLNKVNKAQEHVQAHPEPWMEGKHDGSGTPYTDSTPPKWYLNAYMDLQDSTRAFKIPHSGRLPLAWDRDKFEPYSLVRNRIDAEDLDWLLSDNVRNQPADALLEHTKLEKETLQDIIDYAELPRKQYRNFQGKLRKAIDDPNTYLADRKERMAEAREDDLLKEIGYSDAELDDDKQYRTTRSRGVKVLDELGSSIRSKRRSDRVQQQNDMDAMLTQRKMEAIEAGKYIPDEKEMLKGDYWHDRAATQDISKSKEGHGYKFKDMYAMDFGSGDQTRAKLKWWTERRLSIPDTVDVSEEGAEHLPEFHEALSHIQGNVSKKQLQEAARYAIEQHKNQGAANFDNARTDMDTVLQSVRDTKHDEWKRKKELHAIQADIYGHDEDGHVGERAMLPGFFQDLRKPLRQPSKSGLKGATEFTAVRMAAQKVAAEAAAAEVAAEAECESTPPVEDDAAMLRAELGETAPLKDEKTPAPSGYGTPKKPEAGDDTDKK